MTNVRAACIVHRVGSNSRKLIIQIPCYNEEKTLSRVLAELPRQVEGFNCVEWLVIDDGSTDRTVEVAQAGGVDWIVGQPRNMGLARAFTAGIEAALKLGADVIVNTDGDNQYCSADIPKLTAPILAGTSDMVVGARPISEIEHFSGLKTALQKLGSWVVRRVSQTDVPDSHLIKSVPNYVWRSTITIVRIFLTYRPLRFFWLLASLPFGLGAILGVRWMILSLGASQSTNIPSLIFAAILINIGLQLFLFGLLADLLSANRRLVQDTRSRLRRVVTDKMSEESGKAALSRVTPSSRETEKQHS